MPDLNQLQRWLQTVIMHLDGVREGIASAEAHRLIPIAPDQAEQIVTRSQSLSGIERLEIYGRALLGIEGNITRVI